MIMKSYCSTRLGPQDDRAFLARQELAPSTPSTSRSDTPRRGFENRRSSSIKMNHETHNRTENEDLQHLQPRRLQPFQRPTSFVSSASSSTMVRIDGHDTTWLQRFRDAAAAAATVTASSINNLANDHHRNGGTEQNHRQNQKKKKTRTDHDDPTRILCFMHVDLAQVPWEELQPPPYDDHRRRPFLYSTIQIIGCTHLTIGLRHVFALPIQKLYLSSEEELDENGHDETEGPRRTLCRGLQQSAKTLQQLHISSVSWTPRSMKGLADGLPLATSLQELNLSYTQFRGRSRVRPATAGTTLTDRQDDDNGDVCVQLLADGLAKSQLFCLKLNRCHLKDHQVATLIRRSLLQDEIHQHIENNTGRLLQELYLGGNHLGRHSITALAEYIKSPLCSLVTLGISNPLPDRNEFVAEIENAASITPINHLTILCPALAVNTSLRVLHLASNRLHDDDILPLCQALFSQPLSGCGHRDRQQHIEHSQSPVPRSFSRITMLDLKSNRITDHGVATLAAHLPPQLERLWLLGNPMGVVGVKALYKALKNHVHLVDVRIPTFVSFVRVPEMERLEQACQYYLILNQGGRCILDAAAAVEEGGGEENNTTPTTTTPTVPPGLWPIVLERVNQTDLSIQWGRTLRRPELYQSSDANRLQVLYYLLKNGSVFWQSERS